MTITLTREEAQQVLEALEHEVRRSEVVPAKTLDAAAILFAKLAQPEPEPVADKYLMEVECTKCGAKQDGVLTVTAPPQREWQGLTDEEYEAMAEQYVTNCYFDTLEYAKAIEAKLKEKNASHL
jgi:hypothetical protein